MSGHGRGGGAGRGRASLSFNVEQLGFGAGEMLPGPVLQPPPLFPTMEYPPAPLETGPTYTELLKFKTSILQYINSSSAYIKPDEVLKGLGNFAECQRGNSAPSEKQLEYDWARFPTELKPSVKKRQKVVKKKDEIPNKLQKNAATNVHTLLDELEKKENTDKDKDSDTEDKIKKEEEDGEEDGERAEEFEEEDMDEEMDDGTDYNQNYFDNGEGYLDDEDDNLDDGPIY